MSSRFIDITAYTVFCYFRTSCSQKMLTEVIHAYLYASSHQPLALCQQGDKHYSFRSSLDYSHVNIPSFIIKHQLLSRSSNKFRHFRYGKTNYDIMMKIQFGWEVTMSEKQVRFHGKTMAPFHDYIRSHLECMFNYIDRMFMRVQFCLRCRCGIFRLACERC